MPAECRGGDEDGGEGLSSGDEVAALRSGRRLQWQLPEATPAPAAPATVAFRAAAPTEEALALARCLVDAWLPASTTAAAAAAGTRRSVGAAARAASGQQLRAPQEQQLLLQPPQPPPGERHREAWQQRAAASWLLYALHALAAKAMHAGFRQLRLAVARVGGRLEGGWGDLARRRRQGSEASLTLAAAPPSCGAEDAAEFSFALAPGAARVPVATSAGPGLSGRGASRGASSGSGTPSSRAGPPARPPGPPRAASRDAVPHPLAAAARRPPSAGAAVWQAAGSSSGAGAAAASGLPQPGFLSAAAPGRGAAAASQPRAAPGRMAGPGVGAEVYYIGTPDVSYGLRL